MTVAEKAKVSIVKRDAIPKISEVEVEGKRESLGELRDFSWDETLKQFLPKNDVVNFSWVKLKPGETLNPHVHSTGSMIIMYKGEGELLGDLTGSLCEGDVVTVPAGCFHGFKGVGQDGVHALSVQFGAGLYSDPKNPRVTFVDNKSTLESLVAMNRQCIEKFKSCRFLAMLSDGTLDNPNKKQRYIDALQIWSDKNQDLLFARQGTTTEPGFAGTFLQHFFEEIGHDKMHADRQEEGVVEASIKEDEIIEAIADWFICHMFRSDAMYKAALIHLVIENASDVYHTAARPVLADTINDEYFEVHEADTEHAEMGLRMLRHLSAAQYQSLHPAVEKGWKMLTCMTERVCALVDEVS